MSQEALQNQTRILQSILDSMGDGVIVADEKGNSSCSIRRPRTSFAVGLARRADGEWATVRLLPA